jgi:hypothetical protein
MMCHAVGLAVKPVGEPYSGNRDLRFDERGWETGRWPVAPRYRAHPRLYQSGALRCGIGESNPVRVIDRGDADDRGNGNDIRSRFSSDRCRIEAIQAPCPNFVCFRASWLVDCCIRSRQNLALSALTAVDPRRGGNRRNYRPGFENEKAGCKRQRLTMGV